MTPPTPAAQAMPALPATVERASLTAAGFTGWRSWNELRASNYRTVPHTPAVYVVYREAAKAPQFLAVSPGGRFKGKDPTVPPATLAANWVPGARVLYIGKADLADRRLKQFGRFGAGEPVGHWGGRLIWQLEGSDDLLVAWHSITWTETARDYEKRLLALFASQHNGTRPFANLTG